MAKFEVVSKYADAGLPLPVRATANSAGYDFVVAKDTVLKPYVDHYKEMSLLRDVSFTQIMENLFESAKGKATVQPLTLADVANITGKHKNKPTLVSTGMKCKLDPGTYLELSVRSSCPLKHWLILGNSVGIIDADYYNNPDNEGEIFFQIINLASFPILLKKGDAIGQGIIKPYLTTEDDNATGERTGGFGSTDKK
jgi:dUTP pyrophosphatase